MTSIFISIVVLSHAGFLVLEMFFWNHPIGLRIFSMTPSEAAVSHVLAMNQGLYNGFLATGLLWSFLTKRTDVQIFFLTCIIIAGIFGGFTAKISILFVQGLPALIALLLVLYSFTGKPIQEPAL